MKSESAKTWLIIAGFIVLLLFFFSPFSVVEPGERGLVVRLGAMQDRVLDEGIHFKIPLIEKVIKMDVKIQKIQPEAAAVSKDLQSVTTTIALNFKIDPSKVNRLYQEIGREYSARIIEPAIQEVVKSTTAQFTASELVSERLKVSDQMKQLLVKKLGASYLLVTEFSIVDLKFSEAFKKEIELKQIAQQRALTAENDLKRIQVESEQVVARAKADAESIRIQVQALQQSPDFIQLEAVKKWNGVLPQYMMGNSMPFIQLNPKMNPSSAPGNP